MLDRRWLTQPVKVQRAPVVTDGHGNKVRDWSAVIDVVQGPGGAPVMARIAQMSADELADRGVTVTLYHLRLGAGVDIVEGDRVVELAGERRTFNVEGTPNRARSRRREDHVHAELRRLGGA